MEAEFFKLKMEYFNDKKMEKSSQELDVRSFAFKSTVDCLKKMGYQYVKYLGTGKFGKVVEMLRPNDKYRVVVKLTREKD